MTVDVASKVRSLGLPDLPNDYRWRVDASKSIVRGSEVWFELVLEQHSTKFFQTKWRKVQSKYLGTDLHIKWGNFDDEFTVEKAEALYINTFGPYAHEPERHGFVV